jgi:hypothetical protein
LASNIEGATAPESELDERGQGPGVWTQPTQAEVSWDEDGDQGEGQPLSFWAWLLSPFRR